MIFWPSSESFNPRVSRFDLDGCPRCHGIGNLRDMKVKAPRPIHSAFKPHQPDYLYINVKFLLQMADAPRRCHLFVAIDQVTRWVCIRAFMCQSL